MKIIIYQKSSGEIIRCVDAPWSTVPQQLQEGETYILGNADDSLHYIDNYQVVARPDMNLNYENRDFTVNEIFRVEGIPEGCAVVFPNGEIVVDDGFIEWTSSVTGKFLFYLRAFPFKDIFIYANFEYE